MSSESDVQESRKGRKSLLVAVLSISVGIALCVGVALWLALDRGEPHEADREPSRALEVLELTTLLQAIGNGQSDGFKGRSFAGLARYDTCMDWMQERLYVFEATAGGRPLGEGNEIAVDLGEPGGLSGQTGEGARLVMRIVPEGGEKHGLARGTVCRISGRFDRSLKWPTGMPIPVLSQGKVEVAKADLDRQ